MKQFTTIVVPCMCCIFCSELSLTQQLKVSLHYDENAAFLRQASWFYEPEIFFIRDKMANTNEKTPHFCCIVNDPLTLGPLQKSPMALPTEHQLTAPT